MGIELLFIAIGLSMDAFAVSVCKGLATQGRCWKTGIVTGAWFGGFQALMPFLGYLCGEGISRYITAVSRYVALIVLALIGLNMIREARKSGGEGADTDASLRFRIMLPAAVATSIDAFAVGITLAALQVHMIPAILLIGCTTFLISCAGVYIGNIFGSRFEKQAAVFGGVVLICIGIRIFIAGS